MKRFPTGRLLSALEPWLGTLALTCSADPESLPSLVGPTSGGSANVAGASSSGGGMSVNPLGRAKCQAPPGANGSPRTIEEAIALHNALPKATNVACFVESLDRPFTAYAANSIFSAQPALSARSPRVFIKHDRMWVSIVIDGDSSYLLEFSYLLDELHPSRVRSRPDRGGSSPERALRPRAEWGGHEFGLCHYGEERVLDVTFAAAFASIPFRPRPDSHVSLDG